MKRKRYVILLGAILLGVVLIVGCSGWGSAAIAEDGNIVKVHYTCTLEDGTVFDTSVEREPLEFTLGEGELISGFEEAVRGMQVGQSKMVTIPPEEAYGPHLEELIWVVDRDQLPEGLDPVIGQELPMEQTNGIQFTVIVIDVSGTTITVDANYPMAGKELTFEIELVEIKDS